MKKTILITGANRGLGLALTDALTQLGHTVLMVCRDRKKSLPVFEKLKQQGRPVELYTADMEQVASVDAVSKAVRKHHPYIDVLINNAAINIDTNDTRIENMDLALFSRTMNINVTGCLWMCRAFIPLLKQSTDGRIINFSSGLGQLGVPRMGPYPAYSISKTAVNAITTNLAEELKEHHIAVVSLDPGWVRTDMGGPNAMLTLEEGIATPLWLATTDKGDFETGCFYKEKKQLDW